VNGIAQTLPSSQKSEIAQFIAHVSNSDWESLAESITYPLERNFPVPAIENKNEFIARHSELFDDSLITMISNSVIDSNWADGGLRGIVMRDADLWLDREGNLIKLGYQTEAEKAIETKLIEEDRASLPVFLQEYVRPVLQMDAGKWIIRIDQVKGQSFRFIGWIQGVRNPNRDAIEIIRNGFLQHEGGGGNHSYTFTSDIGKFVCYVNEMREIGDPEGELILYRDGEVYRNYPAISINY